MNLKEKIKDVAIRTIKTFAETMAASITAGAMIQDVDWAVAASVAGLAAVYTILVNAAAICAEYLKK